MLTEIAIGAAVSVLVAGATAAFAIRQDRARLREEQKLDYSIETALRHLLEHPQFQRRSLAKIKRHIRGFRDDNALRLALLRAGAVCVSGEGDNEMWGLLSRNIEDVR